MEASQRLNKGFQGGILERHPIERPQFLVYSQQSGYPGTCLGNRRLTQAAVPQSYFQARGIHATYRSNSYKATPAPKVQQSLINPVVEPISGIAALKVGGISRGKVKIIRRDWRQ